ncbi:hypothetical protein TIFTF001_055280 [Ficus carica]|uniref:Uncharacterized protein n=2 Tax=Ficus carica TaxID=3494 RepID=A0AA88EEY8_FICCA|nr:hypothetical protein TIFTF001_055280 [Ficus carica]
MEGKLIGYDEEPIDVAVAPPPDSIELENLLQKSSSSQSQSQKSSSSSDTATARSRLYEVCTANGWKRPSFECCNAEGPDHQKL